MKKKVTIQDIADALGISRNTVSKAINNSEGLAEATREKILQKAVEMGYKQFSYVKTLTNLTASAQTSASPGFVGEIALLTTAFLAQSHFASLMLDKFHREISQLGYTMNTHRVTDANLRNKTLPVTFRPDRVSAVICIEMFNRAYDEMICDLGLPILFIDGPVKRFGESLPADQLYMDNTTEITRFVYDMLKRGKQRIGFIGDYEHCQSFYERYAAFRCAMLMAGLPVEERHCVRCITIDEIYDQLSTLPDFPEVFICANDFVALDTMQVLQALGKNIPEDIKICGFDDCAESRICKPSLTTIHIHTQIMAYSAVQLLLSRIREPSLDFRTMHTETDLIYRDSTRTNEDAL